MKKFGISLFLLISLLVFSVNSPKQPILFFNVDDSVKGLPTNLQNLINIALYENLDSETNFPVFDSRFSYNFYPQDNVYTVEVAVSAARILGLENQILKKYPLSSPTFEDIKSDLEKIYIQNGYDFSRNFGYMEYINEYFKSKLGVPLFDSYIPLKKIDKSDAIKYILKIFTLYALENNWNFGYYIPMTNTKNMITYAEELNYRLGAGISSPDDIGYISVFEKYFFIKYDGKIIPVIKLPYFQENNTFKGDSLINRAQFYSLISVIFGNIPKQINKDELIPVRTLNNMISYLPKTTLTGEPILFEIKSTSSSIVKYIEPYKFSNDVVKFKTKDGELITLDNSKITVKTNYYIENIVENTSHTKTLKRQKEDYYNGKSFAMNYKYLDEKDENTAKFEFLSSGTIKRDENGIWIVNTTHDYNRKIKIPNNLVLSKKFKIDGNNIKIKWYSVDVETLSEMKKIATKRIPGIPEKYIKLHREVKAEDIPDNIGILFKTEVKYNYRKKIIKSDYQNSTVNYFNVKDRLNAKREYANLSSLNEFLSHYNNFEKIDSEENYSFVNYWKDISKKLNELKTDEKAHFIPEMKINIDLVEETFYQKPKDMEIYFWTFYGGKLVSFEPATYRLFTQKFVAPLKYNPNAYLYVKYKDGTTKSGKIREIGKKLLYNDTHEYLRDMLLWFQVALKVDKYGNRYLEIVYIIAEEI
ncbi:hypothetical protein X275_02920 [Marinitoga sp. 1197]|uniref:hypothetical protein n=1 Tax=Marinitoga sp. 1197 TaxID=1428449 RepID=UPI0006411347|nr:hypothetical protein [Marinitoga sp. 1197]KLO23343.1 hypothetical protein X275_02920 [Marinitoga sp. 1197]